MTIKVDVEFPCGYKLKWEAKFGMFGMGYAQMDEKDFKECPLHGKKCPPKK